MKLMTMIVLAVMVLACGSAGWAQQQTGPALVVQEKDSAWRPLSVTDVDVSVKIVGHIAETRMTMVFYNDTSRILAGDLYFPLPEGATVSGYGLDVNGVMVDGVAVTKEKGRQVFEAEVRKGVDPGLAEWSKGNNFKTRVFPIPSKGSRTVMVRYVTDIESGNSGDFFHLPLSFKDNVKNFHLRIEVVKGLAKPAIVKGGPADLTFGKWRDSFVAESSLKDALLSEEIVVSLPDVKERPVFVEKGPDGEIYFAIKDMKADHGRRAARSEKAPRNITIFWDASGSRGKVDHGRELDLLKAWFARITDTVTVDLVLFRNEMEKALEFVVEKGDASKLIDALKKVDYDGGTQMGVLRKSEKAECCFLFTDGISNFGTEDPAGIDVPVYIFTADQTSNHPFLNYLAVKTGGAYFNLNRMDNATALSGIGRGALSFMGVTVDDKDADEIYPRTSRKVHGPFALSGKLRSGKARITVNYGVGGKVTRRHDFVVSADDAAEGPELQWYWAQKKVDDLLIFPERNAEAITAMGLKYGLVTQGTSLIVLERLEQYMEHNIEPPTCLAEMRKAWHAHMDQVRAQKKQEEAGKLDHVLSLWRQRVEWWEKKYEYPPDFKYRDEESKKSTGGTGYARREERDANAPTEAEAPAPTSAPESRPAPEPPAPSGTLGEGRSDRAKEKKDGGSGEEETPQPGIVIKEWDPQTPYLAELKKAQPSERFTVYMKQKASFGTSPAFFLDCGNFFLKNKEEALAIQILSNIAEMELENAALLRILAHRLEQIGKLTLAADIFEKAKKMRENEPQSWRDLALVIAKRARYFEKTGGHETDAKNDYAKAMDLLAHVVMNKWERFDEIEVIALMDLNAIIPRAQKLGLRKLPVDERLVKNLDCDVRILLNWDADMTDMDLHVTEPSGEKAYYGHNRTTIGGLVSRDFTQGYGPEEYCLRKAMHGVYKIEVNFYGSSSASLQGAVTVQAEVITNFGRPGEQRKSLTLQLTEKKDTVKVGEIEF
jgi:hypothetical protein